ncbi:DUF805 domain-containing protein [Calditrichota bacterium]
MNWYLEVLKKYSVFAGRAHRTEFWMFNLVNVIIGFVFGFTNGIVNDIFGDRSLIIYGIIGSICFLAILIPSIAVSVRRLHDIGRTGWWLLLDFLPIVGSIILIVFLVQDSQPGTNQYGPNLNEEIVT